MNASARGAHQDGLDECLVLESGLSAAAGGNVLKIEDREKLALSCGESASRARP
ncbi:MAG: hypothetical protein WDN46_04800 [Methylocella sp.]